MSRDYYPNGYYRQLCGISRRSAVSPDMFIGNKVEPPTKFQQLSNHKFHELLDRFSKLT